MISLLLIPIAALARRFAGGGLFGSEIVGNIEYDHIPGRRLIAALILALTAGLLSGIIWVVPIVLIGFYLNEILGTHRIFDGMYWDLGNKEFWDSFWFATLRGGLKLATAIPLGFLVGEWYVPLLGLLGMLDGVWYWLSARFNKGPAMAELLSGATYGTIIALSI